MSKKLVRADPSGETVRNMQPAGTAGSANATVCPVMTVRVPLSTAGGTGNAGMVSWINPESSTILVTDVIVYFSTTGTGTYDMGVQSDGTGSADDIIDGGTMSGLNTAVRSVRGRTGTQGGGTLGMADVFRLGPGGTGTNNSIVGKTAETASTAIGSVFISYFPVV